MKPNSHADNAKDGHSRDANVLRREVLQAAKIPAWCLLGLLALLAVNIVCAWLPLGAARAFVHLCVCSAMALALMTFCMDLLRARALLRMIAAVGYVWLAIMIGISLTDFLGRAHVPPPW